MVQKKLLDYSGLQRFLNKIKALLDSKSNTGHTHVTSEVTDLLNSQHTWSAQQSYSADLNLNYANTDVDDILDTVAGSYTAEDFLAQNNVWTGSNTISAPSVPSLFFKNTNLVKGSLPQSNLGIHIDFTDKNNDAVGGYNYIKGPDGTTRLYLELSTTNTNSQQIARSIRFETNQEGNAWTYYPSSNGEVDLGNSDNQWKSVYAQSYYYNGTAWGLDKYNQWTEVNDFNNLIGLNGAELWFKNSNIDDFTTNPAEYGSKSVLQLWNKNTTQYSGGLIDYQMTDGSHIFEIVCFGYPLNDLTAYQHRFRFAAYRDGRAGFYPTYPNVDLGTSTNKWRGTYSQEYHAYNTNAFMAKSGDYTFLIRNDGGSTYFLMSAQGGNEGTWSNARPLTINNATGICDINGSCGGMSHGLQSSLTQYGNSVTYTEGQLTVGTAAGNAYKGSSNNAALISFPENGTAWSTSANVQNLRLAWSGDWQYWHDIFVSPNNNYIWHRNVVAGTARGWRRVVEENVSGLTDQTWSINIGGTSANVTGTVAIANGGTGATSRTSAVSNLFNANIGSSPSYFLTGTSNFGNSGYSSVADVKTALGLSNYVTLDDAQTISGNKTFTGTNTFTAGNLYHIAEDPTYVLKSSTIQEGVVPSGNRTAYTGSWQDKNSSVLGYDRFTFYPAGVQAYEVNLRNKATNGSFSPSGSQIQSGYQLALYPSGNSEFKIYAHTLPNGNGVWNLGDSTHKWKTLNGVNPGALFLPKISSKVSLSERLTDLTGQTSLRYTPPYNGWLSIETDNTNASNFIRCSYDSILVKTDGNAKQSGMSILCPVLAGVEVIIYVKCVTLTSAYFYPALGDVNHTA